MFFKKLIFLFFLTSFSLLHAQEFIPSISKESHSSSKMDWYEDARFGLFIHWGAYSQLDGVYKGKKQKDPKGEWIMRNLKIPVIEYENDIAGTFNPIEFDADSWVKTAYEAGIKYIVITTKHHDGFALFDSKISDYNIVDKTSFKKDIIKELSEACKKYGIRLGVYYSQAQDWYHKGGLAAKNRWDENQEGNWDDYFKNIAIPQVEELLTNYGPISIIWFDSKRATVNMELAKEFESDLRSKYPELILNSRLYKGDFNSYEQVIPGILDNNYNELCITHNRSWSYKASDTEWKSPKFLLETFIHMVSMGGNFLFNVGPNPMGEFPKETKEALRYIGAWMDVNGSSIYGTSKNPFYKLEFGTATVKTIEDRTKIYLHVFDWPEDHKITLTGLNNTIKKAYLLDGNIDLNTEKVGNKTVIYNLPPNALHEVSTVIVLEMDGSLDIDPGYPEFEKDEIILFPEEAHLTIKPQFDFIPSIVKMDSFSYFENWRNHYPHPRFKNTGTKAHWKIKIPKSGQYNVWIRVATRTDGNILTLKGQNLLQKTLPNTGGMDNFQLIYIGKIKLQEKIETITITGGKNNELWDFVRVGDVKLEFIKP